MNDSTTIPNSARSVSFKEPVIHETYDPPSSKSQSPTVISVNRNSVLDRIGRLIIFLINYFIFCYSIVIPPPEEYQQNYHDLEKRNQLLNDEVQQLRLNNRVN